MLYKWIVIGKTVLSSVHSVMRVAHIALLLPKVLKIRKLTCWVPIFNILGHIWKRQHTRMRIHVHIFIHNNSQLYVSDHTHLLGRLTNSCCRRIYIFLTPTNAMLFILQLCWANFTYRFYSTLKHSVTMSCDIVPGQLTTSSEQFRLSNFIDKASVNPGIWLPSTFQRFHTLRSLPTQTDASKSHLPDKVTMLRFEPGFAKS